MEMNERTEGEGSRSAQSVTTRAWDLSQDD